MNMYDGRLYDTYHVGQRRERTATVALFSMQFYVSILETSTNLSICTVFSVKRVCKRKNR